MIAPLIMIWKCVIECDTSFNNDMDSECVIEDSSFNDMDSECVIECDSSFNNDMEIQFIRRKYQLVHKCSLS